MKDISAKYSTNSSDGIFYLFGSQKNGPDLLLRAARLLERRDARHREAPALQGRCGGLLALAERGPAGFIFACTEKTREECFARKIFGMPEKRRQMVESVRHGTPLFLYNHTDRTLQARALHLTSRVPSVPLPGALRTTPSPRFRQP